MNVFSTSLSSFHQEALQCVWGKGVLSKQVSPTSRGAAQSDLSPAGSQLRSADPTGRFDREGRSAFGPPQSWQEPREQGAVSSLTLPMTWSGATEGKSGLKESMPWGTGGSLWALVNRSGNKHDKSF